MGVDGVGVGEGLRDAGFAVEAEFLVVGEG